MSMQFDIDFDEFYNTIEETISRLYKDGYVNETLTAHNCKDLSEKRSDAWDIFKAHFENGDKDVCE